MGSLTTYSHLEGDALGESPQRMGDKENSEINAAGENYRVNTAKVVGGGARVGSSFSEDNSRAQSSDMERGPENRRVSEDIPEAGGCCCGCGWKDFKQCLPSLIILIGGLTLMALIIPYAFASVIKQLQEEEALRNMRSNVTMEDLELETQANVAL